MIDIRALAMRYLFGMCLLTCKETSRENLPPCSHYIRIYRTSHWVVRRPRVCMIWQVAMRGRQMVWPSSAYRPRVCSTWDLNLPGRRRTSFAEGLLVSGCLREASARIPSAAICQGCRYDTGPWQSWPQLFVAPTCRDIARGIERGRNSSC